MENGSLSPKSLSPSNVICRPPYYSLIGDEACESPPKKHGTQSVLLIDGSSLLPDRNMRSSSDEASILESDLQVASSFSHALRRKRRTDKEPRKV